MLIINRVEIKVEARTDIWMEIVQGLLDIKISSKVQPIRMQWKHFNRKTNSWRRKWDCLRIIKRYWLMISKGNWIIQVRVGLIDCRNQNTKMNICRRSYRKFRLSIIRSTIRRNRNVVIIRFFRNNMKIWRGILKYFRRIVRILRMIARRRYSN